MLVRAVEVRGRRTAKQSASCRGAFQSWPPWRHPYSLQLYTSLPVGRLDLLGSSLLGQVQHRVEGDTFTFARLECCLQFEDLREKAESVDVRRQARLSMCGRRMRVSQLTS